MNEEKSVFDDVDLEDVDLEEEEEPFEEITADLPDSPYWMMERKTVDCLLRIVALVAKSNIDVISKSVICAKEGDKPWILKCTDKDVYFQGVQNLKNESDRLMDKMILDSRQLMEVARNSRDVVLYVKDNTPYVNLLGGFYPLERYAFDTSLYEPPSNQIPDTVVKAKVDPTDLLEELNVSAQVLSLANRVEDKKVIMKGGFAYGSFLTVGSMMHSNIPDMTLRGRDVEILKLILSLYSKEDVHCWTYGGRNYFHADSFFYSATASQGKISEDLISKFKIPESTVYINGAQLYHVLKFLDSPTTRTMAVSLECGDFGVKLLTSSRKGAKSQFALSEEKMEKFKVELQVTLAKKVFAVVKDLPSITLSKGDGFLRLGSENLNVVMGVK